MKMTLTTCDCCGDAVDDYFEMQIKHIAKEPQSKREKYDMPQKFQYCRACLKCILENTDKLKWVKQNADYRQENK